MYFVSRTYHWLMLVLTHALLLTVLDTLKPLAHCLFVVSEIMPHKILFILAVGNPVLTKLANVWHDTRLDSLQHCRCTPHLHGVIKEYYQKKLLIPYVVLLFNSYELAAWLSG